MNQRKKRFHSEDLEEEQRNMVNCSFCMKQSKTKQNKTVMVEVFKRLKETHMMNRKLLTAAGYGERGKMRDQQEEI